jgi:hypothetical protein
MLPDDLRSGVSLEALRALIPTRHKPVRIDHVDCIVGNIFDEQPISAFVVRQMIGLINHHRRRSHAQTAIPNRPSMKLFLGAKGLEKRKSDPGTSAGVCLVS